MDFAHIGEWSDSVETAWTSRDARLYALGVGAGIPDPTRELAYTTENSIGVTQVVLPTMAIAVAASVLPDIGEIDWTAVRIAGQSMQLHRPLPVSGGIRVRCRLTDVEDKGKGVLMRFRSEARDLADDVLTFELGLTWFVRGQTGTTLPSPPAAEGRTGSSLPWERPEREPDRSVEIVTRPEQALLYRLSGHPNPIHSDPVFAQRAGFPRPILQGPATLGICGRVLLNEMCGGDPGRFGSIDVRFSSVVFPGDPLSVLIWKADGGALFQMVQADGTVVLDAGRFEPR